MSITVQETSTPVVHFKTGNEKGDWALCIDGWNSSRNVRKARELTADSAAVTCKTCRKMLARQVSP